MIKYHMRRDIREAAGLGNRTSDLYHQLCGIRIFAELRKLNYKESQWARVQPPYAAIGTESPRDEIVRANLW